MTLEQWNFMKFIDMREIMGVDEDVYLLEVEHDEVSEFVQLTKGYFDDSDSYNVCVKDSVLLINIVPIMQWLDIELDILFTL